MKKTIRRPSSIPLYGAAAVWLVWCLFLPLYRLWHFAALLVLTVGAFFGLRALFPGTTEEIEVEEPAPAPVTTGDPERDKLLEEGQRAVAELTRLRGTIPDPTVQSRVDELADLTDKIFKDIVDDPKDVPQVKRFASYYLPTTMKLLNAYDRMSGEGAGENVSGTLRRIEDILDTTVQAYRKQYDALFANEALDIETDITVLESMLKREGLSGGDFKI